MLNIIFAIDNQNGYAKDGFLPWDSKTDMSHFRKLTIQNIIIMGRKTWESLPMKPLINRINIIVSKTISTDDSSFVFDTLDKAIEFAKSFKKEIFVIGGAQLIYEALQKQEFKYLYLTQFNKSYDCNKFINLPLERFEIEETSKIEGGTISKLVGNFYNPHDTEYLNLVRCILKNGNQKSDRTGTGTISTFGYQMRFDIRNSIPILTTKYIPWKSCVKELLWFLKGNTDAKILQEQGVRIWDGNTSREFLDNRGLSHLPEGDIGAGYGFQWRHFGGQYVDCNTNYDTQGFDQIEYIIKELKSNPDSRRIFMSAWNPMAMDKMALLPCHVSAQFYVEGEDTKYLSCHLYQRSMDVFLGAPWNILSYSILTYYLAGLCNYKPKELIISTGDTHIYSDHLEQVEKQLNNLPYQAPTLRIEPKEISELSSSDVTVENYKSNKKLFGKMSV